MTKMTITSARGTKIELAANHNMGLVDATLPNGQTLGVYLADHPTLGPVLSSQSQGVEFAALNISLNAADVPAIKDFVASIHAASAADPNTYVGSIRAYDKRYANVIKAMEG